MTGTAMTEAAEFQEIYKLEVVEIPTNLPVDRKDADDEVYRTAREKYEAIVALIEECRERKQPILVGTTSHREDPRCCRKCSKAKVPHQVLNARHHEHAAVLHALVLAAQALPILSRTKNSRAEQPVALRLEGAVVDGFRLGHFAMRPAPDFFRRRQRNADGIEIRYQIRPIGRRGSQNSLQFEKPKNLKT